MSSGGQQGDRATEFLAQFSELEDHLRKAIGAVKGLPFNRLVDEAAQKDSAIRRHAERLKDYADLRNAIVHHRGYPNDIIADPTERTLIRFRQMIHDIASPKCLIPTFQREVRCFSPDEALVEGLRYMRDHDFSQVVVRTDGELALLTTEGISRWLEQQAEADIISVTETKVKDALKCDAPATFQVMSRDRTVYDALDAFLEPPKPRESRLFAIIITQSGSNHQEPIGIVTPWDVIQWSGDNRQLS